MGLLASIADRSPAKPSMINSSQYGALTAMKSDLLSVGVKCIPPRPAQLFILAFVGGTLRVCKDIVFKDLWPTSLNVFLTYF